MLLLQIFCYFFSLIFFKKDVNKTLWNLRKNFGEFCEFPCQNIKSVVVSRYKFCACLLAGRHRQSTTNLQFFVPNFRFAEFAKCKFYKQNMLNFRANLNSILIENFNKNWCKISPFPLIHTNLKFWKKLLTILKPIFSILGVSYPQLWITYVEMWITWPLFHNFNPKILNLVIKI